MRRQRLLKLCFSLKDLQRIDDMFHFKYGNYVEIKIKCEPDSSLFLEGNCVAQASYSLPDIKLDKPINTTVIVEMFIPRGGSYLYGILGADYLQLNSSTLEVNLFSGNLDNPRYLPQAIPLSKPQCCLPEEFYPYIFRQMDYMANNNDIKMRGILNFRYAAYCGFGSCGLVCHALTYFLIELFSIPKEEINSDRVAKLYSQYLRSEIYKVGFHLPPPNTRLRKITTAQELSLFRVHQDLDGREGRFFVREKEIKSFLTGEEKDFDPLRKYLGLRDKPMYITQVNVPAGSELIVGRIGAQPSFGLIEDSGFQYFSPEWLDKSCFGESADIIQYGKELQESKQLPTLTP